LYGYKTKKTMFRNMDICSITAKNNSITFETRHHEKLEGWCETERYKADYVTIPPQEIGAALRLALSRCTTKGL
jgi:hypothetical protein